MQAQVAKLTDKDMRNSLGGLIASCKQNNSVILVECSDTQPGPAKPFMRIQATRKTRQQLREDSPSGVIQMDKYLGKRFTNTFLIGAFAVALSLTYLIDWAVMNAH